MKNEIDYTEYVNEYVIFTILILPISEDEIFSTFEFFRVEIFIIEVFHLC